MRQSKLEDQASTPRRPYVAPTLAKRETLARITAKPATSGISTDTSPR